MCSLTGSNGSWDPIPREQDLANLKNRLLESELDFSGFTLFLSDHMSLSVLVMCLSKFLSCTEQPNSSQQTH